MIKTPEEHKEKNDVRPRRAGNKLNNAQKISLIICSLLALTMILDYSLFSKTLVEKVVATQKSYESYYNAARNAHYSYHLQAESFDFSVSEYFASKAQVGQEIKIEVSPIFREVNSYSLSHTGHEVYSLRRFSGLILPILILLTLAIGYKYGNKFSTLSFMMEALTIANLIYLLN